MNAKIAKIRAEAELYSSQTRARADKEVNVAVAEAKRLKADALTPTAGATWWRSRPRRCSRTSKAR